MRGSAKQLNPQASFPSHDRQGVVVTKFGSSQAAVNPVPGERQDLGKVMVEPWAEVRAVERMSQISSSGHFLRAKMSRSTSIVLIQ